MEFMGISVGVLALICALVLLFGVQGTRKILGWSFGLLILGAAGIGAFVWAWPRLQHDAAAIPPFDPSKPYEVLTSSPTSQQAPPTGGGMFDDLIPKYAASQAAPKATATSPATPITILPALVLSDNTPDLADKIRVTGPDKRTFVFLAGTEETAILSYMQTQYGAPGTPRAECWAKEPGPWCDYRLAR